MDAPIAALDSPTPRKLRAVRPHEPTLPEALLDSVAESILAVDPNGEIRSVNPATEELFERRVSELIGTPFNSLLGEPHATEYSAHIRAAAAGEEVAVLGEPHEVLGRRASGSTFPLELTVTRMEVGGESLFVSVARDITERKRSEEALRHLADHDALTGLFNRRRFENELTRHTDHARRYGAAGSLLVIDVDNFKYVNDTLGHKSGDQLIQEVAGVIRSRLRKTDVLGRLGGDEFAVLLHAADGPKATGVAEELRKLIGNHPFVVERQPIRVTASIGVAPLANLTVTADELLAQADLAMYRAKEDGRDRVIQFSREDQVDAEERRLWSERVRQAIDRGRFVIMAQPIMELESGGITQHELLIRMRGEDGKLVTPDKFLSTAERFGHVQALDRWMAQQAIRLLSSHARAGNDLVLEVNLSAKTMADTEFPALVGREIAREGIDPSKLVFEVTETAAVADIDQARKFAASLTRLGCRFALDDFGSGFASFYYLKHLPISYLKIDGEFIRDLPRTPVDQLLVKALVQVAQGMGIKTVAEFVEDEETLELLRAVGVTHAQGYFIGRPAPAAALSAEPADAADRGAS